MGQATVRVLGDLSRGNRELKLSRELTDVSYVHTFTNHSYSSPVSGTRPDIGSSYEITIFKALLGIIKYLAALICKEMMMSTF